MCSQELLYGWLAWFTKKSWNRTGGAREASGTVWPEEGREKKPWAACLGNVVRPPRAGEEGEEWALPETLCWPWVQVGLLGQGGAVLWRRVGFEGQLHCWRGKYRLRSRCGPWRLILRPVLFRSMPMTLPSEKLGHTAKTGEEGIVILEVLADLDNNNDRDCIQYWFKNCKSTPSAMNCRNFSK